jgi:hypothetical protein
MTDVVSRELARSLWLELAKACGETKSANTEDLHQCRAYREA